MNLCRTCGQDFGSIKLFDKHRVGAHDLDPPHENGRRCLTAHEMTLRGWRLDERGRWSDPIRSLDARQRLRAQPTGAS